MRKENSPKLKVVWQQVFPRDAELRIQRAFEMLLGDGAISKDQLVTIIDKGSLGVDNKVDEKKSKQTAHPSRSGRKAASFQTVGLAVLKSKKTQRK